eukprot:1282835-Pleurochrysis_carterae.AAC.1
MHVHRCFAAALAIVFSTLLSVPLFHFSLQPVFVAGASCTVVASVLYARAPKCENGEAAYEPLPTAPQREQA